MERVFLLPLTHLHLAFMILESKKTPPWERIDLSVIETRWAKSNQRTSYGSKLHQSFNGQKMLVNMAVEPKIGVFPQNGWWKSWKTLLFNGWFGGKPHYFRFHIHISSTELWKYPVTFQVYCWFHEESFTIKLLIIPIEAGLTSSPKTIPTGGSWIPQRTTWSNLKIPRCL